MSESEETPKEDSEEKAGKKKKEQSEKKAKAKSKVRKNADNPPFHDMIIEALETLDERKGTTLVAIKRYLEDYYHVDVHACKRFIKRVIISGVESGQIIRTQGKGVFGRFKVKPSKPVVAKKRKAPVDYVELPMVNSRKRTAKTKPRPKAATPHESEEDEEMNERPRKSKSQTAKQSEDEEDENSEEEKSPKVSKSRKGSPKKGITNKRKRR